MAFTKAQIQAKIDFYTALEEQAAAGQTVSHASGAGSRSLSTASLSDIRDSLNYWINALNQYNSAAAGGSYRVRLMDWNPR